VITSFTRITHLNKVRLFVCLFVFIILRMIFLDSLARNPDKEII